MRRLLATLLSLTAFLGILARTSDASASCGDGRSWAIEAMPIPVYLNTNLTDLCAAPGSTCGSLTEIRRSVEAAMAQWHQETGTRLRMVYAGTTNVAPSTIINGAIHVFAGTCGGGTLGVAAWPGGGAGEVDWGKIRMCTANDGGTLNWVANGNSDAMAAPFRNVFQAELAHLLGMDHTEDCPGGPKSISSGGFGSDLTHLFPDDIDYLQTLYGVRYKHAQVRGTVDGDAFFDGYPSSVADGVPLNRLGVTNSASSRFTFTSTVHDRYQFVEAARFEQGEWVPLSGVFLASTYYPTGIAARNDDEVVVAWQGAYDPNGGATTVYVSRSTDGARTWGAPEVISNEPITSAGVGATYDPASDRYLFTWRGPTRAGGLVEDINEIMYRVDGVGSVQLWDGVRTADTPSIACGPTAEVGTYNCLMAWVDGDSWQLGVRYIHFRVQGDVFEFHPSGIRSLGYIAVGSPSVAYFAGAGSARFQLALSQGGATIYTWRKDPDPLASFTTQRATTVANVAMLPALGSRDLFVDQAHLFTASACPDPGDGEFCVDCGPCAEGKGDCDNDSECRGGLTCSWNVGANYGYDSAVDVCECPVPIGDPTYCAVCGPCDTGMADCDTNAECEPGLVCQHDVGPDYGYPAAWDVCDECPWEPDHPDYCRDCGPCEAGVADCDSDAQCRGGLVCSHDVGAAYGLPAYYDVCECPWDPGTLDYCRDCGPCTAGQGDCDSDAECEAGFVCHHDVGASYGLPASYDVCLAP